MVMNCPGLLVGICQVGEGNRFQWLKLESLEPWRGSLKMCHLAASYSQTPCFCNHLFLQHPFYANCHKTQATSQPELISMIKRKSASRNCKPENLRKRGVSFNGMDSNGLFC